MAVGSCYELWPPAFGAELRREGLVKALLPRAAAMALECDYLLVGSGAIGMAFLDTLVHEDEHCTVIVVDRHAKPGGHWVDSYEFVTLHQPAAFYGVNSEPLERDGDEKELSSGQEIRAYFDRVMRKLQATGRVQFLGMTEFEETEQGVYTLVPKLAPGAAKTVRVKKKLVDAISQKVAVPSIRGIPFPVADGISTMPINGLFHLHRLEVQPERFVVMGAGKTGIDAVLFLLNNEVDPSSIRWIMPQDSWIFNRERLAFGGEHAMKVWLDVARAGGNVDDPSVSQEAFEKWAAHGGVMRIDESVEPTSWKCSTVNEAELAQLRQVLPNIVRLGRILAIDSTEIVLEKGSIPTDKATMHVDATAMGLGRQPLVPIWSDKKITVQNTVMCNPTFSAAVQAHIEADPRYPSDDEKNSLCAPILNPIVPSDNFHASLGTAKNRALWEEAFPEWLMACRLSGLGAPDENGEMDWKGSAGTYRASKSSLMLRAAKL